MYGLIALCFICFNVVDGYLFDVPGLVWIEEIDGAIWFQHICLQDDLWKKSQLPEPVTRARTAKNTSNFTHVDVDIENRTMVMFDATSQRIMALTFDSHDLYWYWELFEGTSSKVNGISVDWVTDVVYWTDAAYDMILAVSMFSPNKAEIIVDTDLDEPFGIVVLPRKGFLFWTDIDEFNPRLMRSSLGGRHIKQLLSFSRDGRRAKSLYIDTVEERIYWMYELAGGDLQGISSCDSNGEDIKHLQIAIRTDLFDIGIFANQLFYIEYGRMNIYHMERSNKGPKSVPTGVPLTLTIIDKGRQYIRSNPCLYSGCPGLCTMSNITEDCFCDLQQIEFIDPRVRNNYCGVKQFTGLLLPKGDGIYTLTTNFIEYKSTSLRSRPEPQTVLNVSLPVKAVASDVRTMKIYFYEYSTNVIKSLKTEAGAEPEVISFAVGQIGGLAFDSVSRNLFWTDVLYGHIMVTQEDGSFPYVLHRNLEQPRAIAVHPSKRLLFWSETVTNKVVKSYMDGSEKFEISMGSTQRIVDIAIDFRDNRLFMCAMNALYEVDFDGNKFITHYRNTRSSFTGISLFHDYVVLSDTSYRSSGLHVFDRKKLSNSKMTMIGSLTYPDFRHGNWHGVRYHHLSNQPDGIDLCSMNHVCEQLCLPGKRGTRCVCSVGYRSNGGSCEIVQPYKPFLLLADQRYSQLLQIHAVTEEFMAVPVQAIRQPFSIAYDPVKQMVYWSDLDTGSISRAYVNGTHQEVIIYDKYAYFTGLFIEPGSRLLFYIERKMPDYELYIQPVGSVVVYNIDTRKTLTLLDRVLQDPENLVVNLQHGFLFLTEQHHVWRLNISGTDLVCLAEYVRVTSLYSTGDYVYFSNEIPGESFYDPVKSQIIRMDVNGGNMTVMLELEGDSVYAMAVDQYFLFWVNGTTRGVQKTRLLNPGTVEDFGPSKALFKPTGLYVGQPDENFDTVCTDSGCRGVCLPTMAGPLCVEKVMTSSVTLGTDDGHSGLCKIPDIKYGDVIGNDVGRVVPNGYKAKVECYPAHRISQAKPITCVDGEWSHIPSCFLEYSICGTPGKGYKVYRNSGHFFAYPEHTKVDVVCVGGGGGGYDVANDAIVSTGRAGDGGDSSFGSYLNAFGGRGGSLTEGGKGGFGHVSGGSGSAITNCTTGGTAGQAQVASIPSLPGYSHDLFCGAGGFSYDCSSGPKSLERFAGPGGHEGNGSSAGYFGGGAGSRGGGSGGGGGWSRLTVTLPEKALVPVTVGNPGYPSYGHPAPGLVVVMWGDYRVDDYVSIYDVINNCVIQD